MRGGLLLLLQQLLLLLGPLPCRQHAVLEPVEHGKLDGRGGDNFDQSGSMAAVQPVLPGVRRGLPHAKPAAPIGHEHGGDALQGGH